MVHDSDSLIRRAVPRYEEMTARLVDYLPAASSSILELGCGTGNLSLALAARYPDAEITFVDAAGEMLAASRARLTADHPQVAARARFLQCRFEDLQLAPSAFDLIASCISLHHLRGKAPLYPRSFAALVPGGSFRFPGRLCGGTDLHQPPNWSLW